MAENNKVTIDAAWFAELYAAKKDKEQYAEAVLNIAKERDELKAKLEKFKTNNMFDACLGNECVTVKRLAAAERCIEEMWSKMHTFDIPDRQRLIEIESIIRAYREKMEAAR